MIDIGKVGIWNFFETQPAAKVQEATAELEELGFKVVWMPEAVGREVMTAAGLLLSATRRSSSQRESPTFGPGMR
jgi:hypothetical protein